MDSPLANVPSFAICPPVRCYFTGEKFPSGICGKLATWKRPGGNYFADEYFCDEHRESSDILLPAELLVRRVRIEVSVFFAGASVEGPKCTAEALARLEQLVQAAGGALEIQSVRPTIGKYAGQTASRYAIAARIDPV